MIPTVLVIALGMLALAYVAFPLRDPASDVPIEPSRSVEEARARKEVALGALRELDDDALMGKISDPDLAQLRARYESEAIDALLQLDLAEASDAGAPIALDDAALEKEIEALREQMRCGSCGAVRVPDESCPRCGA